MTNEAKRNLFPWETVFEGAWLSLRKVVAPDYGVNGYVYSHESRCQGRIVALLPFRREPGLGALQFLLTNEMTPCWGQDQPLSAITGGFEGDIEADAVREMLEETGYVISREELVPLGTCFASKSSDTVYTLYTVDLTDKVAGRAVGDGSRVEAEAETVWVYAGPLAEVQDPLVSVMHLRFLDLVDVW